MEKIIKEINIYKFDELKEEAQNKVLNDYIDFLLTITDFEKINKNTNLYKAVAEAERMQTPWFTCQYVYEYCQKQILKEVKKYRYYEDGNLFQEV